MKILFETASICLLPDCRLCIDIEGRRITVMVTETNIVNNETTVLGMAHFDAKRGTYESD